MATATTPQAVEQRLAELEQRLAVQQEAERRATVALAELAAERARLQLAEDVDGKDETKALAANARKREEQQEQLKRAGAAAEELERRVAQVKEPALELIYQEQQAELAELAQQSPAIYARYRAAAVELIEAACLCNRHRAAMRRIELLGENYRQKRRLPGTPAALRPCKPFRIESAWLAHLEPAQAGFGDWLKAKEGGEYAALAAAAAKKKR